MAKKCIPCHSDTPRFTKPQAEARLKSLHSWSLDESGLKITKKFRFKNFYETISFVNAIAWIANKEDHHPCLTITFNTCDLCFYTHAIQGLSENDFICAEKIDQLEQL